MTLQIGVIAEDRSDVNVLYQLTKKIIPENSFCFRQFLGHGSGKLRRKCASWAGNLIQRGCKYLVIMHDLDGGSEEELRRDLSESIAPLLIDSFIILIPVQEIEAWLLCDASALKTVFHVKKKVKVPTNPEIIPRPKEYLRDLVWRVSGKQYVNSIHNERIAAEMRLTTLNGCQSFNLYPGFLLEMTRTNRAQ